MNLNKAFIPKLSLTKNFNTGNLMDKANQLIQMRVNREMRKNTEDLTLEKLEANKDNDTDSETEAYFNITPSHLEAMRKFRGHHKESVARPLPDDSEDDATPNRKRYSPGKKSHHFRVSDNISRLMDDKRSTIKEQVEDEEEFTGSSLNISGTLHFVHGSKH